jgi:thioredoxin 1
MSERDEIRQKKAEELKEQLGDDTGSDVEATSSPDEPVHVTGGDHLDELVGDGVVLVDFHAEWCGPCKMLEPIVERIAANTDATVAKVDIDEHQRLAQQYRVQGVPTLYLFAGGEQVDRVVGVKGEDALVSMVEQYT